MPRLRAATAAEEPVTVIMLGEPVAWARAAGGRNVRLFTPTKQRNNAATLRMIAMQEMRGRQPFDCPVVGFVTAELPIPQSWSKKKQEAALRGEIWPGKKPDLSNILKQIEDALNGIVFRDDALIVRYDLLVKRYSTQPKIVATYRAVS